MTNIDIDINQLRVSTLNLLDIIDMVIEADKTYGEIIDFKSSNSVEILNKTDENIKKISALLLRHLETIGMNKQQKEHIFNAYLDSKTDISNLLKIVSPFILMYTMSKQIEETVI